MSLGNPMPAVLGMAAMAAFCGLLSRWVPLLPEREEADTKALPLDGLRGVLASAVFFHHACIAYGFFHTGIWAPPNVRFYAQLGPTAVTLFFFISGYLFWGKMLRDPRSVQPARLLPNRVRRIMPAYLAAVALFFLLAGYQTRFRLLAPLSMRCSEVVFWLLGGFPIPGGPDFNGVEAKPNTGGMFWTLQQEWLFYLLLPLLGWFRPMRRLLLLAGATFAGGLLLAQVHTPWRMTTGALLILTRFSYMFPLGFVGGMLAAYRRDALRLNAPLRSPWMIVPAAMLVAATLFLLPADSMLGPFLLLPVFLAIAAGNDFGGLLSSRPLRALGAISYSLYIFHGLILRISTLAIDAHSPIRRMTPAHYWLWMVPVGLAAVSWSTLSYRFLERPFMARREPERTPELALATS